MSYYFIVFIQILCVLHVINNRKDRWWIWLIVLVPVVGSLVYIAAEVLRLRDLGNVQQDLTKIVNPGAQIKQLEKRLAFADTHQNKIALADAYLALGESQKAIDLYESSLTGLFQDDPHVNTQLVSAYYQMENYEKALERAQLVLKNKDFQKSPARLHYALALEQLGKPEAAEKELEALDTPYTGYENRIAYGQFLIRHHKTEKAAQVFEEILSEYDHLNKLEKRKVKKWMNQAQEALSKLQL
ncbi:MAG: hypothetical protein NW226_01980 [Microscillaceae bacterium]|nr:hypothetical protein [Microscillaceae bacterium]